MGTVPMGTGELRRIHSRVVWMSGPVERSMTVSAPHRVAQVSFSTSSSMDEVTAELPMLALTFTRNRLADDHGLGLGVVDVGRQDGPAGGDLVAHQLGGHALPGGHEAHLRGDLAPAGVVQLGDRRARGPQRPCGRTGEGLRVGLGPAHRGPAVVAPADRSSLVLDHVAASG